MKRMYSFSLLLVLLLLPGNVFSQSELQEKLAALPLVSNIEPLQSATYSEKYVVRITQPLDHQDVGKGNFTQRVVVHHTGFDKPTVLVTEGYGGSYALHSGYQEELSKLFDANVVFVEHRYFLESTPDPLDWQYLTAENSAYDLHRVTETLKNIYTGKWISTGISKGGQTSTLYRAYFPDDVDISVPYVAPLNRAVEDERHISFLEEVGTKEDREKIFAYQIEVLKRKEEIIPLLSSYSNDRNLTFRISPEEVLDYCVLEYPFALWQWGTPTHTIPSTDSDTKTLFEHLIRISGPEYFSEEDGIPSFFVQAARELGYYPYETEMFKPYLTIPDAKGYLYKLMLPQGIEEIQYSDNLYRKIYSFLEENDPKMIFIYGEYDPWSATRVPDFENKKNLQIYMEPGGSHRARIGTMPEDIQQKIIKQLTDWLAE